MLITFDQKEYQKLNDKSYQLEKRRLQIELLKLQEDVIKNNRRLWIIFEGSSTYRGDKLLVDFTFGSINPSILDVKNKNNT